MASSVLATRHHHFDVERAVFMTVLHRVMVSGSDRSALQWRRGQAIDGAAELELQHLYRAMGWLGEALAEPEPDAPSPRRTKDLIKEELFARRRDLFTDVDLVFFDTNSQFFTGEGGETLGQYGKSKDRCSDCKQMVLGMVIDGDGVPVCSEMWQGNAADVATLDRVAERLQRRFGVRRVCVVADAGMISMKMIAANRNERIAFRARIRQCRSNGCDQRGGRGVPVPDPRLRLRRGDRAVPALLPFDFGHRMHHRAPSRWSHCSLTR